MDLLAALFMIVLGTANGWAIHEWWTRRQKNRETPYRAQMRCSVHGVSVSYKSSDETALINFLRKWDDQHGSCVEEGVE